VTAPQRVAIFGASSGIGIEVARRLAAAGHTYSAIAPAAA